MVQVLLMLYGAINANTSGEIDFTGNGKLILSSSITKLRYLDHEPNMEEQ